MNEEQIRRIIREEIREAFSSVRRTAGYESWEDDVARDIEKIFESVLFDMQEQPAHSQVPTPHNPFECRVHDYVGAGLRGLPRRLVCTTCGHEEN